VHHAWAGEGIHIPPKRPGLAAEYPGDVGVETHSAVVFTCDFEIESITDLKQRWSDIRGLDTLFISDQVPPGSRGKRSLEVTAHRNENVGGLVFKVLEHGYDKLHMRFYVKFAEDHPYVHHFVRMGGMIDPPPYPVGGAGKRPESSFSVGLDAAMSSHNTYPAIRYPPPGIWAFYNYWPDMRSWQTVRGEPDPANPSFYGNGFYPDPVVIIPRGEWICVEVMVKMNCTPESFDGEVALWIDGELVAHYSPGSLLGYWVRDQFRTDKEQFQSRPFEGFRWLQDMQLRINTVKLESYVTEASFKLTDAFLREHPDAKVNSEVATVWFDHFVVATEYIGPFDEVTD
jgi:hypothetical protein